MQKLTPVTNQAPAVVSIDSREPSGGHWARRFSGSNQTRDLASPFRDSVEAFIGAMRAAGAVVSIAATFRPVERAYLMHWAWGIVKRDDDPKTIPAMEGVNIRWDHLDTNQKYSADLSLAGAEEMVRAFDMQNLETAPALASKHTEGLAIDMSIKWTGTLSIIDAFGERVEIETEPRSGMNEILRIVGKGYGVIKYNRRGVDKPHWSSTGA